NAGIGARSVVTAGGDDACCNQSSLLRGREPEELIALASLPLIGLDTSEVLRENSGSLASAGDRCRSVVAAEIAPHNLLCIRDEEERHVIPVIKQAKPSANHGLIVR